MSGFLLENCGTIALLAFFIGFVLIAVNVMRPSRKAELEAHALMPLKEQD